MHGYYFFYESSTSITLFYFQPEISFPTTTPSIYFFQLSVGGGKQIFQYLFYAAGKDVTLRREKRKICCYLEFLVPASLASSSLAIPRSLEVFLPPALLLNFMSALNLDQATTDSIIPDYAVHSIQVHIHIIESNKCQNG